MRLWYNKETSETVWFPEERCPGDGYTEKPVLFVSAVWDEEENEWEYVHDEVPGQGNEDEYAADEVEAWEQLLRLLEDEERV
jgi:hypothetical protein